MALDMSQLGADLADPFVVLWNATVLYIPGIIAALIILIFGYLIASLIGFLIRKVVDKTKLDDQLINLKFEKPEALGGLRISQIVSKLTKWWVFILFLSPAADVINLEKLASLMSQLALWAPHFIVAVIIMIIGLIAGEFLASVVGNAKELKGITKIKTIVKFLVIIFFADMALQEIGINIVLAQTTMLMILAGFVLIFVIGFGVGLIKPAQKLIEEWIKKRK